jgi:hypothetical protein
MFTVAVPPLAAAPGVELDAPLLPSVGGYAPVDALDADDVGAAAVVGADVGVLLLELPPHAAAMSATAPITMMAAAPRMRGAPPLRLLIMLFLSSSQVFSASYAAPRRADASRRREVSTLLDYELLAVNLNARVSAPRAPSATPATRTATAREARRR